jgi:hypothetical protein
MGFTKGNKLSKGRPKGSLNKSNPDIGDRLDNVINGLMDTIDIDDLNTSQKIKMLQIALQYRLPKLQAINTIEEIEELPLFEQIQIVTSVDEKERLEKVEAYEKEHNVQIL